MVWSLCGHSMIVDDHPLSIGEIDDSSLCVCVCVETDA